MTDQGQEINLRVDSPAYVKQLVYESVCRWRWRRISTRMPALNDDRGMGAWWSPLRQLLHQRDTETWGPKQKSALRSVLASRQWPQARLFSAGLVEDASCRLCQNLPEDAFLPRLDASARRQGCLLHRSWLCPALQVGRTQQAPSAEYAHVCMNVTAAGSLDSSMLALYTRGLLLRDTSMLPADPPYETFIWHVQPA
eukprot:12181793-Karenia_brevis.AAC.1